MKKANNEQPEKDLQCQAELCGRENRLNALGCVAIYLADGIFSLTNDRSPSAEERERRKQVVVPDMSGYPARRTLPFKN